jgi:hypothetical protein
MRKEYKTWPEYQQANSPRRDRRRKVIQVNNRRVNAHKFLASRAKSLPKLIDKETGNPINHEANLKAVYDGKGIEGVNQYVQAVKAICERDKGGIWQKIKGWCSIIKVKFLIKWRR